MGNRKFAANLRGGGWRRRAGPSCCRILTDIMHAGLPMARSRFTARRTSTVEKEKKRPAAVESISSMSAKRADGTPSASAGEVHPPEPSACGCDRLARTGTCAKYMCNASRYQGCVSRYSRRDETPARGQHPAWPFLCIHSCQDLASGAIRRLKFAVTE